MRDRHLGPVLHYAMFWLFSEDSTSPRQYANRCDRRSTKLRARSDDLLRKSRRLTAGDPEKSRTLAERAERLKLRAERLTRRAEIIVTRWNLSSGRPDDGDVTAKESS